jgi:hypothetical protein
VVGVVEGRLQGRADPGEHVVQAVEQTDPVGDRVGSVGGEQGQPQRGRSAGEIHHPADLTGQRKNLTQTGQDRGLVVADLLAPDRRSRVVDRYPPVVGLAGVDSDP